MGRTKDAYYFPHDSNARNDPRLLMLRAKHGPAGYGVYFMLIEMLREQSGYKIENGPLLYPSLALGIGCTPEVLKPIIDDCVTFEILKLDTHLYSESLCRRMMKLSAIQAERAEAGRNGGLSTQSKREANVKQTPSKRAIKLQPVEKSREEKSREENVSPSPAEAGGAVGAAQEPFNDFWKAYPNRVGKAAALRIWKRLRPTQDLVATILAAVERQKTCDQWIRESGRFIPNPTTWLHQGRWDDETTAGMVSADQKPGKRPWACGWCGSKTAPKGTGWGGAICAPCEKKDDEAGLKMTTVKVPSGVRA